MEDLRRRFTEHLNSEDTHGPLLRRARLDRQDEVTKLYKRIDALEMNMSQFQRWQQRIIGGLAMVGFLVTVFGALVLGRLLGWIH